MIASGSVLFAVLLGAVAAPVVAQDCPEGPDFAVAPIRVIRLPSKPVDLWGLVRGALTRWRDSSFAAAYPPQVPEREPPYLAMEAGTAAQLQQQAAPQTTSAHTCFFEGRLRRTDFHIAFWVAVHEAPAQKGGGTIELRWLGGSKGAGERAWGPAVEQAGKFAESLAQRIEALLR